jgi:hypothetical protein
MFDFAQVIDHENDPTRSGRVKVRIYNKQNKMQEVKDDDLPWASVMHPITSAATSKIGVVPSGLVAGSRVIVMYHPDDTAKLYPIVMGSIARGDLDMSD